MQSLSSLAHAFWWLPDDIDALDLTVEVGHHEPWHEDDFRNPIKWIWESGQARDLVARWRRDHDDVNVYVKLQVTTVEGRSLLGPLVLDIDCEHVSYGTTGEVTQVVNDLSAARQVAVEVQKKLDSSGIVGNDVRTYFSGRKGFQFEIRPSAVGCSGAIQDQIDTAGSWEQELLSSVTCEEPCHIDRAFSVRLRSWSLRDTHCSVRIPASYNCWFDTKEIRRCRRKALLSRDELCTTPIDQICGLAEAAQ